MGRGTNKNSNARSILLQGNPNQHRFKSVLDIDLARINLTDKEIHKEIQEFIQTERVCDRCRRLTIVCFCSSDLAEHRAIRSFSPDFLNEIFGADIFEWTLKTGEKPTQPEHPITIPAGVEIIHDEMKDKKNEKEENNFVERKFQPKRFVFSRDPANFKWACPNNDARIIKLCWYNNGRTKAVALQDILLEESGIIDAYREYTKTKGARDYLLNNFTTRD